MVSALRGRRGCAGDSGIIVTGSPTASDVLHPSRRGAQGARAQGVVAILPLVKVFLDDERQVKASHRPIGATRR
jgi:hypothetical protein